MTQYGWLSRKWLARGAAILGLWPLVGCAASEVEAEAGAEVAESTQPLLSLSFNGVRIAMSKEPSVAFTNVTPAGYDAWLGEVQSEFYTHVAITVDPSGWAGFTKVEDLEAGLRRVIGLARAHNLKVIPLVPIGSGGSGWWGRLNDPPVQMNRVTIPGLGSVATPTYAPDVAAMDQQLRRLLQTINRARTSVDDVDAVLLAYDEFAIPYSSDGRYRLALPGGAPNALAGSGDTFSQLDRSYVLNETGSRAERFAKLINTSLYRRMKLVQQELGNATRVLAYGDEWDPEATGGYKYHTFDSGSEWTYLAPDLRALTGLDTTQKSELRSGVVFLPWNYTWGNWPNKEQTESSVDTEARYNAYAALDAFDRAGLRFIYVAAYDGRPGLSCEAGIAMQSYVNTSRCFPRSSVGYMAAWWGAQPITCANGVTPPSSLEIRHELYVANANSQVRPIDDHFTAPLSTTSTPWKSVFGNPSNDTANDRLVLTYDDVVSRAPVTGGYAVRYTATFNGDMAIYPDFGISNLSTNYPALRRVGSSLQLGGLMYGKTHTWGSAGAFVGQSFPGSTAQVTLFVKSGDKQIAMKANVGGAVTKSGFVQYPAFNSQVLQLVGGNNSGSSGASSTIGSVQGCYGLDDNWMNEIYRNN